MGTPLLNLSIFWAVQSNRLLAQELAWRECAEHCRRIKLELRAKRMRGEKSAISDARPVGKAAGGL
jgi:hypothetical protein